MKKIVCLITFLFSIHGIQACDICGCSSGNYFIGPYPQFNKYMAGMRYTWRNYKSEMKEDNSQFSNDFYKTMEFMGGIKLGSKWELISFIPYQINRSQTDDGEMKTNGVGDVTVLSNYCLLDHTGSNKEAETVSETIWVGVGVKTPTGKFDPDMEEIVLSSNNQAGTGSIDFLFNASCILRRNDFNLSTNINYKINQFSKEFRFGNRFHSSVFIFKSVQAGNITFHPNAGMLFEQTEASRFENEILNETGGKACLAALGMEIRFGKLAIGGNFEKPVLQNFSDHQTKITVRGMAQVSYMF